MTPEPNGPGDVDGIRPDVGATNIAIVRRLFEAVETRGDPEDFAARWAAYVAMYDPDVVIHETPSLPYGGDYSGDDAVARHAQAFSNAWQGLQSADDRRLEPHILADGDHVIVLWRQKGTSADGDRFDMPAVSVYQMKDGRVVDSRMFHFDAAAVTRFLERASRPASAET
jgi:ketosteroid isomerase-like protein